MYFPEGFEDEDEYDYDGGDEDVPDDDYDEEDYYHHHGYDDLYDDVGEDYDYDVWHIHDLWTSVKDHEMALFEYSPEFMDENPTVVDVLRVAEMTIKLVDAIKVRLSSEERDRCQELAIAVSVDLGSQEKVEQLHNNAKEAKKSIMKTLKRSLSEVLPVFLDEHILENILSYLNLLSEEANEVWKFETEDEVNPFLSSLYQSLAEIYRKIRGRLFDDTDLGLTAEIVDHLQEIVSEFSNREDNIDNVEEGEKDQHEEEDDQEKEENPLEKM